MHLAVLIPALNEEDCIAAVASSFLAAATAVARRAAVVVVDNGSTDHTAARAAEAGAHVVHCAQRGYGAACLAGLRHVQDWGLDVICFADGDGADNAADLPRMLGALHHADMVIGSRVLGQRAGLCEASSLTMAQHVGNRLAASILRYAYHVDTTDLGPLRCIRTEALTKLRMDDTSYGWTVQMQARAARAGLRTVEVPVHHHRRRTGTSKISGNLRASVRAGELILRTLASEWHFHP
jgi:glycosyltransferase involved in cell wall biosynthesis